MSPAARPGPARSVGSFVAGMFTRNIAAKFGAFVLAALVWITVRAQVTESFTVEGEANIAVVRDFVDEGLMIPGELPRFSKVEFEGPIAEIEKIRTLEKVEIGLRVRRRDLAGQPEIRMTFSVEKGDLTHGYGIEVRIKSVEPSEVNLTVAERKAATIRVERPAVDLKAFREWNAAVEDLSPEVRVIGPRAEIEKLEKAGSLTPAPVDGAKLLDGRQDLTTVRLPVKLELPEELRSRAISLALRTGETFDCKVLFTRTLVKRDIQVPIVIYYESTGMEDATAPPEKKKRTIDFAPREGFLDQGDRTFLLTLRFEGPESELDELEKQIAREIEEGTPGIRAYVRERDLGPDAKFFDAANVRLEGQLPPGVRHFPPSQQLGVDVKGGE